MREAKDKVLGGERESLRRGNEWRERSFELMTRP
jgi:hypothetical protein